MRRAQAAFDEAEIFLSPLHYAVTQGDIDRVTSLLESGSDPNYIGVGKVALHYACETGNLRIVDLLIGAGANIRFPTIEAHGGGKSPLQLAYYNGHAETVRKLIHLGAPVEKISLLHLSLLLYDATTVDEILREWKRDVNLRDVFNQTPLHVAAKAGYITLAKKLLQTGICPHTVNATDCDGLTPLAHVINARTRLLKKRNEAAQDRNGSEAPSVDSLPSYEELMCRGSPDIAQCNADGYLDFIRLLLDYGADVSMETDSRGYGLLHRAGERGDVQLANVLLECDTTILEIANNPLEITALYCACENGHTDVMRALLEKGANANPRFDKYGRVHIYPLQVAVRNKHYVMVDLLLKHGAKTDVFHVDDGNAPIHDAAINQSNDIVELLLAHGAKLDIRNKIDKETILHLAWRHGNLALFDNLIDNHQTILDSTERYGQTTFLCIILDFIQSRRLSPDISEKYIDPLRKLVNLGCLLSSPKAHKCKLNVMSLLSDVYTQEDHFHIGHDVTRFLLGAASGRFASLDEKFLIDLCFFRDVDVIKFCIVCGYTLTKTNVRDSEILTLVDCEPRSLKSQCRLEIRRILLKVQDTEMEKIEDKTRRSFTRFVHSIDPRKRRGEHTRSLHFRWIANLPLVSDELKKFIGYQ